MAGIMQNAPLTATGGHLVHPSIHLSVGGRGAKHVTVKSLGQLVVKTRTQQWLKTNASRCAGMNSI